MGRVIKATGGPKNSCQSNELSPSIRQAVIELAAAMAERIIETEVDRNPALLEKIFTGTLVAARGLEEAVVHVHPLDRQVFNIDRAAAELCFSVCSDETVGRGGCRIVGRYGEIDASVRTLTDAFQTILKGAI